jgi:hypothetical protein
MAERNSSGAAGAAPSDGDGDRHECSLRASKGPRPEGTVEARAGQAARTEMDAPGADVRVTVVISAHNEAEYLAAALQSVAEQDDPLCCLDCVVVDNASTDATAQVAAEFARQHAELHVTIVKEPSLGVSRAKNCGAQQAAGALLLFLDADSRCAPHLVRDVVTHYHAGSPAGSIRIVADSDSHLERGFFALMELGPVLFGIRSQMFYCGRQLFLELGGFDEALQLAEDLEFLRRAQALLSQSGMGTVCHIRTSAIATSPRRLRTLPYHLSIVTLFVRWALAFAGIGRKRRYSA